MPSSSSNRRSRTSRLLRTVAVVFAGFLLLAAGWVGVRLLQAIQSNQIRCYILSPPLTLFEKDILAGEAFSCQAQNCRVVTRFNTNRGIMCLFPGRGLAQAQPTDIQLAGNEGQNNVRRPFFIHKNLVMCHTDVGRLPFRFAGVEVEVKVGKVAAADV